MNGNNHQHIFTIHHSSKALKRELPPIQKIQNAYVLAWFGDSITTDHISPAGNIAKNSPCC
jgi:aconitate hydratase